jgi:hypothetical protein
MRYMLSIIVNEDGREAATPEQIQQVSAAYGDYTKEVDDKGILVAGDGLEPSSTATTVRVRDGERSVTDGPFAESKEQLAGYYVLDCKDLDDAIEWAAKIPGAQSGAIEVRPVLSQE